MRERKLTPPAPQSPTESADDPVIPVRKLLGKNGQARLEHNGDTYLLRITRNGKLILTK